PRRCRYRTYSSQRAPARRPRKRTYSQPGRNDRHQTAKSLRAATLSSSGRLVLARPPHTVRNAPTTGTAMSSVIHAAALLRATCPSLTLLRSQCQRREPPGSRDVESAGLGAAGLVWVS